MIDTKDKLETIEEQYIKALLEQRSTVEAEIDALAQQLKTINAKLKKIGYKDVPKKEA
jgi:uncharacterized protein (UPF0335 family)